MSIAPLLTIDHNQTNFSLMDSISLSKAKASLGRLADRTLKTGQPVIISRRGRYVQLLPWEPIEPIILHPDGTLPVTKLERELEKLTGPNIGPDEV